MCYRGADRNSKIEILYVKNKILANINFDEIPDLTALMFFLFLVFFFCCKKVGC